MRGTLLNLVEEGLAKLDSNWRYIEVNEGYAEMLNCSPADVLGKNWIDCLQQEPVNLKHAHAFRQRFIDGDSYASTRLFGVKSNGVKFEQQISILATYNKKHDLHGYLLFAINVQHQAEARKELRDISSGIAELKSLFEQYLAKK